FRMGKNSRAKLKQRNEEQFEVGHVFERKLAANGTIVYLTSWVGYAQKDWLPLSAFSEDALDQVKILDAILDEPGRHPKPQYLLDHEEAKARGVNVEKHTPGYKTPRKRERKEEEGERSTAKRGRRPATSTRSSPSRSLPRRFARRDYAESDTPCTARRVATSSISSPARSLPKRAAAAAAAVAAATAAAEDSNDSVPYEESDEEPVEVPKTPVASDVAVEDSEGRGRPTSARSSPARSLPRRLAFLNPEAIKSRRAAASAASTPTKTQPRRGRAAEDSEDSDYYPGGRRGANSTMSSPARSSARPPTSLALKAAAAAFESKSSRREGLTSPPRRETSGAVAAVDEQTSDARRAEREAASAESVAYEESDDEPSAPPARGEGAAKSANGEPAQPPVAASASSKTAFPPGAPAAPVYDVDDAESVIVDPIEAAAKAAVASAALELEQAFASPIGSPISTTSADGAALALIDRVLDGVEEPPLKLFSNSQARELEEEIKEEVADHHDDFEFGDEQQPLDENETPPRESSEASPELGVIDEMPANNRLRTLTEQSRTDAQSIRSCASANPPSTTHRLSISSFEAAESPKRTREPRASGSRIKTRPKKTPAATPVAAKSVPVVSDSEEGSEEEDVGVIFPLSRVFDRMTHTDGTVLYLTSWQGSSDMTWEPLSSFNEGCMDLIRELEDILDNGAPEPFWFKRHKSYMARQQARSAQRGKTGVVRGRVGRPPLQARPVGRPPVTRPGLNSALVRDRGIQPRSTALRGRSRGLAGRPHSTLIRPKSAIPSRGRGRGRGKKRGFGWSNIKRHVSVSEKDHEGVDGARGSQPRPTSSLRGRGRGRRRGFGWSNVARHASTSKEREDVDVEEEATIPFVEERTASSEIQVAPVPPTPRREVAEDTDDILAPLDSPDSPPFDWKTHLDRAGGWPAPINAFWKRRLGRFNNKFADHIGKLCRVPDFDLNYEGNWSTVGSVMAVHGPWVKMHVLDTATAYATWFLCDDPVLLHFESLDDQSSPRVKQPNMSFSVGHNRYRIKIEKAMKNEDGTENLVPKEVFEGQTSWEKCRPITNKFEIGHKLETYDPIAGDGFFHPATVLDVHSIKEEIRIHYDGQQSSACKTLSYRDWRLFPCGYAAAIGWTCNLPESAEKKASLRGRWREKMVASTAERAEENRIAPTEEDITPIQTQRKRAPMIPGMRKLEMQQSPSDEQSTSSPWTEVASAVKRPAEQLAPNGIHGPPKTIEGPPAKKPTVLFVPNEGNGTKGREIQPKASSSKDDISMERLHTILEMNTNETPSVKISPPKVAIKESIGSGPSVMEHIISANARKRNEGNLTYVHRYIKHLNSKNLKKKNNVETATVELSVRASKNLYQQFPTVNPEMSKGKDIGKTMLPVKLRTQYFPVSTIQSTLDTGAVTLAELLNLKKQQAHTGSAHLRIRKPSIGHSFYGDAPSTSRARPVESRLMARSSRPRSTAAYAEAQESATALKRRFDRSPTVPMREGRPSPVPPITPSKSTVTTPTAAAAAVAAAAIAAATQPRGSAMPAAAAARPQLTSDPQASSKQDFSASDILRIILETQMTTAQRITTLVEDLAEMKKNQSVGTKKVEKVNQSVVELQQNHKLVDQTLGMGMNLSHYAGIGSAIASTSTASISAIERERARLLQEQVELLREENRIIREKLEHAKNQKY
ncbi:hypothetical protein PMAYCL1PPCAC_32285, partial [Pristionchus mayeri]